MNKDLKPNRRCYMDITIFHLNFDSLLVDGRFEIELFNDVPKNMYIKILGLGVLMCCQCTAEKL